MERLTTVHIETTLAELIGKIHEGATKAELLEAAESVKIQVAAMKIRQQQIKDMTNQLFNAL